jgi:hypothetical protein
LWSRFLKEARAQARIQHEHVCRVYDTGQADGEPYIAMQARARGCGSAARGGPSRPQRASEASSRRGGACSRRRPAPPGQWSGRAPEGGAVRGAGTSCSHPDDGGSDGDLAAEEHLDGDTGDGCEADREPGGGAAAGAHGVVVLEPL